MKEYKVGIPCKNVRESFCNTEKYYFEMLRAVSYTHLIRKIRLNVLIPVCIVLVCVFSFDHWYSSKHPNSGKGITNSDVRIIAQFGDGRDYYQKL